MATKKKIFQNEAQLVITDKTSEYTVYKAYLSKHGSYREMNEYYNQIKGCDAFFNALIDELEHFFTNPDPETQPLQLEDFLSAKKIARSTWFRWCIESPPLDEAWENMKVILASRRETGMLRFKLHPNGVMRTLRHYSPLWEEIAQQEKLDKQDEQSSGNRSYTVIIEALPPLPDKNK